MNTDPFDLARFVVAQTDVIDDVLAELRAGHKQSHWMWFMFPQLAALGRSPMAKRYGLSGLDEARAYLAHPLLGERLVVCCRLLLDVPHGRSALEIFGPTDEIKLRSCLSLFMRAKPQEQAFAAALARYFGGVADPLTERLLG